MDPKTSAVQAMRLPDMIMTPTDVNRLRRELEALEEFLLQAKIRQPGTALRLPRTSLLLDEFASSNRLNLLVETERTRAEAFLDDVKEQAPVVHISFASDPSAAFMGKLIVWFRHAIHPQLLLRVGLQPTIAAGCIVRTANHSFDFSLRQRFIENRHLLIDELRKVTLS